MTFSATTLQLFQELLGNVQLPASAANFEEIAAVIVRAKSELAEALADSQEK